MKMTYHEAKRLERDAWTDEMFRRARSYVAQGMPHEDAEEKASQDIRREIRNGPPIRI